jgi:hypothetical protein
MRGTNHISPPRGILNRRVNLQCRWYYTFAGDTSAPGEGQYSVWHNTKDWVITLNDVSDAGWHDIVVRGSSPLGDIAFY